MPLPLIAAVAGGAIGAIGSNRAARTQARAANDAARMQIEAAERASAEQRAAAERAFGIQSNLTREGIDAQTRGLNDANRIAGRVVGEANAGLMGARNEDVGRFDPFYQAGMRALGQYENALAQPFRFNFQADPGYQFMVAEAQDAVQNSVAARQGLNSGAAMDALQRTRMGLAAQEYGNIFDRHYGMYSDRMNRLGQLAANGQAAAGAQAGISQGAASQMAGNTMQGGMFRAGNMMQGGVNTGNALMNLGSQLGNLTTNTGNQIAGNIMQAGQAGAQGVANAGSARAAGTVGMANAFTGAINNGVGAWQYNNMLNAFANPPTSSGGVPRIGMPMGGR